MIYSAENIDERTHNVWRDIVRGYKIKKAMLDGDVIIATDSRAMFNPMIAECKKLIQHCSEQSVD